MQESSRAAGSIDPRIQGITQTIADEVRHRGLKISVVCVPKTIDNDIPFIDQSFGFQTAFAEATKSIQAAHVEAKASPNGVGLSPDGKFLYSNQAKQFGGKEDEQVAAFSIDASSGKLTPLKHFA